MSEKGGKNLSPAVCASRFCAAAPGSLAAIGFSSVSELAASCSALPAVRALLEHGGRTCLASLSWTAEGKSPLPGLGFCVPVSFSLLGASTEP